ncbi:MAG: glycosyltransferase family protein [Nannocystaceae bacterium]|nr:glycosyltransferase [Myxococcales bacterium]
MARIVYGLTAQGRGHTSRVSAMADLLAAAGHELLLVCGGDALSTMREAGRDVVEVPVLRHQMHKNRIRLWRSLVSITRQRLATRAVIGALTERVRAFRPDLVITDFETYSAQAAERLGLPIVCLDHQQIVTRTEVEVPRALAWEAWVARRVVSRAQPRRAALNIISSFFFPPLRPRLGAATVLVPPILRDAVLRATPTRGDHVLVYHNAPEGLTGLVEALARVDRRFVLYNLEPPKGAALPANLEFRPPSTRGFLRDLAACEAVISTAGFSLISEAMYLGKPMLLLPNAGLFEQAINAHYFVRAGGGAAIFDRPLTPQDVRLFLSSGDRYRAALRGQARCGNARAHALIERTLERLGAAPPLAATRPHKTQATSLIAATR